ncbi:MAG: S8 family peptidase [Dehalococcoidia bacterium]|nr:S8 family peptidase [Dehalococcoidia bacterium]
MNCSIGRKLRGRAVGMLSALSVLLLLATGMPASTSAAPDRVDVIIAFHSNPGPADEALVRGLGGRVKGAYSIVPAIAASVPAAAVQALQRNPRVAAVEPDIEVRAVDLADVDTTEVSNAWGVDRLDASLVWPTANGAGVGVAIVDTGSGPHPDLPGAVVRVNCLTGTCVSGATPVGNDDNGHGTHVAGTALALSNGVGVVGMAPGASLFSYKVLSSSGSGSYSAVIAALDSIVKYNITATLKIKVANFSLGSSQDPGSTTQAAFDNAYASGVLVIGAAGNSGNPGGKGNNVIYPARYASVVAVAATDKSDKRAYFSSTGPTVELAAPGVSIYSTWLSGVYYTASGTSMATPHVTGAAALVFASDPAITASAVRLRLDSTAINLGAAGKDSQYGWGLVNPRSAAGVNDPHP